MAYLEIKLSYKVTKLFQLLLLVKQKLQEKLIMIYQNQTLKSLTRIDRLNRLIWDWDKEEATYYIETMRKDLIKFKEDFQK